MKRHILIVMMAIAVVSSSGCATSSTVIMPTPYVYSPPEQRRTESAILILDQAVNDIGRVLQPKSPVCGQTVFTIQNGTALADSIRQTTEALFERVTVQTGLPPAERLATLKGDSVIQVKLERFIPQMIFSGSSKSSKMLDARITSEIVIDITIKGMNNQGQFTTRAASFQTLDHTVGICEHGASDLTEVISKSIRETTEKYALAVSNFRKNAAGSPPSPRGEKAEIAPPAAPADQEIMRDSLTGMELILVRGGFFQMGDIFHDGYPEERPLHQVYLGNYYIGKIEVTQGQWKKIMGDNPSQFQKGDAYPVENVSWDVVKDFISALNQKTGRKFRLPSEAEWEYASRSGGKREKWAGTSTREDLDEHAWYDNNSAGETHEVGTKKPNGIGLFDMSGNVEEWVEDWYGAIYYEGSPRENPKGPDAGTDRVYRGGSWANSADAARTSNRGREHPAKHYPTIGFRLAHPWESK